jgi:hypothetical protein
VPGGGVKQILQRVAGLIVAAASAYACLNVPLLQIKVFIGESEWHQTHSLSDFDIVLWVGATAVGTVPSWVAMLRFTPIRNSVAAES